MIFYFTATGNSLYVAKNLGGELVSIPQERLGKTYTAEVIGVVCPIFCHDLPSNVREFLRAATFNAKYFFLVMTYGFMHGGAAERAEKLLRDSGTEPDYVNVLKMVDNALPAFDIAQELQIDKQVEFHLAEIKNDIAARRKFLLPTDKANADYHEKFLASPFKLDPETDFRAKGRQLYTIGDNCIGCGVCSKVCPRGCFTIVDKRAHHDLTNCVACLACIHACKRRAIHFTFPEKNPDARYLNPHVKLSEIIAANRQIVIRPAEEKDFARILQLNAADVEMLSPLDEEILSRMAKIAALFQVAEIDGQVAAFQIIFRENVGYWSENYKWFCENYPRFLYVDRIVVDKNFRRHELGRKFYEEVFNLAKTNDIPIIAAEIDIAPKFNAASIAFHHKMGFHEVGTRLFKGTITVSLQIKIFGGDTMSDKKIVEDIVRDIAKSFNGADSTKNWTDETIWFDAAPYASVGVEKAKKVFDEAFGNLKSCNVTILDMRTFINGNSALVCSVQKWDTVNLDGRENPPFMMRQTDYLEKRGGEWKVLHEHTSAVQNWDGKIDE